MSRLWNPKIRSWLDNKAPSAPVGLTAHNDQEGVKLNWRSKDDEAYYAIYRFLDKETIDIQNPAKMLKTLRKQEGSVQSFVDTTVIENSKYTYVVTAVDRLHNESNTSGPATVHGALTRLWEPWMKLVSLQPDPLRVQLK